MKTGITKKTKLHFRHSTQQKCGIHGTNCLLYIIKARANLNTMKKKNVEYFHELLILTLINLRLLLS